MRVFEEEQRFTQTWLILLLSISAIISIIIITDGFFKGNIPLNKYVSHIILVLIACGFIFIFKLKTRIDHIGIHYQFFPFHLKMKTILWENIKQAKTRKYNALTEYGGWGLKSGSIFGKRNGLAINVSGDIGIQLILKTDKKILIGTQKQNDANIVIAKYSNKI
ncbi:hypothetical protein NO995_01475 [Aestuariibaculum sp. M13]|uniref:hypothetical protein n=1 Tax=Aestuariibaculum sp. M13 TaxID=2967132 RepID=UPI002159DFFC|nr:hypothetical protein [Aestuariibaculum sp. M13]MCR8666340.1 hypothetical protein [Aestuariibaculum sp. M13]